MTHSISSEASQPHDALNERLIQLKNRIINLKVLEQNAQQIGWVKDVVLAPNGQLSLVIAEPVESPTQFFFLNSNLIRKIDYRNQSVYINLNFPLIQQLPKYNLNQLNNLTNLSNLENLQPFDMNSHQPEFQSSQETTQEVIRLLEERIVVERGIQKVGEVIIRKEIETEIIEVPIRREKLIVEQVGTERRQLAEIDLSQKPINQTEVETAGNFQSFPTVQATFRSPQAASDFLKEIASQPAQGFIEVHLVVMVKDADAQAKYQEWCNRYSQNS